VAHWFVGNVTPGPVQVEVAKVFAAGSNIANGGVAFGNVTFFLVIRIAHRQAGKPLWGNLLWPNFRHGRLSKTCRPTLPC
jgi:hypothetical protein